MAERAREAGKTVGDEFVSSAGVALGAICDYCPDYPLQIDALARFLRSPDAPPFLATLSSGTVELDQDDPPDELWCRQLLAYACGLSQEAPAFPTPSADTPVVAEYAAPARSPHVSWMVAAAGVAVVALAGAIVLNTRGAGTHPVPARPVTVVAVPAAAPVEAPAFIAPTYTPSQLEDPVQARARKPRSGRGEAQSQRRTDSDFLPLPPRHVHVERPAPKPPELHPREKPPEEGGE
jgi:hypothetical protein